MWIFRRWGGGASPPRCASLFYIIGCRLTNSVLQTSNNISHNERENIINFRQHVIPGVGRCTKTLIGQKGKSKVVPEVVLPCAVEHKNAKPSPRAAKILKNLKTADSKSRKVQRDEEFTVCILCKDEGKAICAVLRAG